MRRWLLPFCLTLSAVACGDLQSGQAGAPPSATPTSASAPAADCVALGAISPIPVPPLAVVDLGDGTKRVTSAEAGYSLVVPGTWLVSGAIAGTVNPWFGQGHMSSYDPRAAPTPRPEAGTILPPEVGVRLDIEMWANPLREPLDIYAQRVHIGPDQIAVLPGAFVRLAGGQAYRMTIQDERRFQPSLGPLVATRQTRAVWLVPSPRADRVVPDLVERIRPCKRSGSLATLETTVEEPFRVDERLGLSVESAILVDDLDRYGTRHTRLGDRGTENGDPSGVRNDPQSDDDRNEGCVPPVCATVRTSRSFPRLLGDIRRWPVTRWVDASDVVSVG